MEMTHTDSPINDFSNFRNLLVNAKVVAIFVKQIRETERKTFEYILYFEKKHRFIEIFFYQSPLKYLLIIILKKYHHDFFTGDPINNMTDTNLNISIKFFFTNAL